MQSSAPHALAERDLLRAWAAAVNITVEEFLAGDEQAAQRALDAYPRPGRVRSYVELLAKQAGADPARLAATAEAARAKHAELIASGQTGERTRHFLTAAILAERGVAVIRDVGAEDDLAAQQELAETIRAGWLPQPEAFRPGIFDRHRLPRRLARRLSPRWHYRRLKGRGRPSRRPSGRHSGPHRHDQHHAARPEDRQAWLPGVRYLPQGPDLQGIHQLRVPGAGTRPACPARGAGHCPGL